MKHFILLTALSLGLLFAGCEKEGPIGPAGADGVDGNDGNANVISKTFVVYSSEWDEYQGNGYTNYEVRKNFTEVTTEMVENGAIIAYMKNEDFYVALPWTVSINNFSVTYTYGFKTGYVSLAAIYNQEITGGEPTTKEYKVVFIDGTPPTSLNLKDYEAVKNYYSLGID